MYSDVLPLPENIPIIWIMSRLLLVDDAKEIQDLIVSIFEDTYEVDVAETISIAGDLLRNNTYSLLLLDLGLPDGSGYDLLEKLGQEFKTTAPAVMVLSARKGIQDKVQGFQLGIDDYIEKPFNPIELKARVEAKIRKSTRQTQPSGKFTYGPFDFDLNVQSLNVSYEGKKSSIAVTPIEFKILLALCRTNGKTISRQDLISSIWSDTPNISKRGIDTHVSHLRKKLEFLGDIIESQYGEGYRLTKISER
jgi:DNA-binding response OmpR family regulator